MTEQEKRDMAAEFGQELNIQGRNKETTFRKIRYIKKLFEYLEERDLRCEEVRVKEAQEYQGWLLEKQRECGGSYARGSIMNFIKAAVNFFDFLKTKGRLYSNPFKEIRKIRISHKLPRNILKEKQMNALLEELNSFEKAKGLRNQMRRYKVHVISEVMYSTGMRISEAAGLKEEDIDFSRGSIEVRGSKGTGERTVFLNEYAKEVLRLYIEHIKPFVMQEGYNKGGYFFGAPSGRLTWVVNREIQKAGCTLKLGHITSHGFRHAVGYHFLKAGCDIRYIQDILGHKRIGTTELYTKVDKGDLKNVLDKYHPRKFKSIKDE